MQLEDSWFLFEKWLDPYQDMLEKNAWAGVGGKWHISPYGQPKTGLFTRQLSKWNGIYFEFYQYKTVDVTSEVWPEQTSGRHCLNGDVPAK